MQVESLAQLGVQFLLFHLGLEFSLHKMRAVGGVALVGVCFILSVVWISCLPECLQWTVPDSCSVFLLYELSILIGIICHCGLAFLGAR